MLEKYGCRPESSDSWDSSKLRNMSICRAMSFCMLHTMKELRQCIPCQLLLVVLTFASHMVILIWYQRYDEIGQIMAPLRRVSDS